METFFVGCEHYGHSKIIEYCNRPFKTIEENDKKIINNCNSRVKEDDTLYHLGDFCLHSANDKGNGEILKAKDYIKQLNGNHIFICGNHDADNRNSLKTKNEEITIRQGKLRIQLIHDPAYAKIDYDIILHSHVHNAFKLKELRYCNQIRLCINCGVDVNKFSPISLDEVLAIYYKWQSQRDKIAKWETPTIIKEMNNYNG